jgi:hypothetical protein
MDSWHVIIGMQETFVNLSLNLGLTPFPKEWLSPYSNVMAIDVQWARQDRALRTAFRTVNETRCVWLNRWGDMPLWGATITLVNATASQLFNLDYFHASHNSYVRIDKDGKQFCMREDGSGC